MKKFIDKVYRLRSWNYSSPGTYFVTISTSGKSKYLGQIRENKVHLNRVGQVALQNWSQIPQHFPFVSLGEYVIMPDHVHGIIVIRDLEKEKEPGWCGDTIYCVPTPKKGRNTFGPQSGNLGSVIRGFKASVKAFATINNLMLTWQSRYHDKILWEERTFREVSKYIRNHPQPFIP